MGVIKAPIAGNSGFYWQDGQRKARQSSHSRLVPGMNRGALKIIHSSDITSNTDKRFVQTIPLMYAPVILMDGFEL